MTANESDLIALTRRFDINRNGRISLRELRTILQAENNQNSQEDLRASRLSEFSKSVVSSPKSSYRDVNPLTASTSSYSRPLFYSPNRSLTFLKHYQELYPFSTNIGSPLRSTGVNNASTDNLRSSKYASPYKSTFTGTTYRSPLRENLQNTAREIFERTEREVREIRERTKEILRPKLSPSRELLEARERDIRELELREIRERELREARERELREIELRDLREQELRESQTRELRESRSRASPNRSIHFSPKPNNYFNAFEEEIAFQGFIKELIYQENEIERVKSDLALKVDFNLNDAFRIFESNNKGYLSEVDFKYGLNFLDVYPVMDEIQLLIRRFSSKGNGFLK